MTLARFTRADEFGLWQAGDLVDDLGWESPGVPVRVLRLLRTGETVSLTSPFDLGIIEGIEPCERSRVPEGDEIGHACSQPRCKREAVIVFSRTYHRRGAPPAARRWYCCDLLDHSYGRVVLDGQVYRRSWFPA